MGRVLPWGLVVMSAIWAPSAGATPTIPPDSRGMREQQGLISPSRQHAPLLLVNSGNTDTGSSFALNGPVLSSMVGIMAGLLGTNANSNGSGGIADSGGASNAKVTDKAVSTQTDFEGDIGDGYAGRVSTKVNYDRCPDPTGKVSITFVSKSALTKANSKASANVTVKVQGSVHYDDDARSQDWQAESHVEYAASGSAGGSFVDVSWNRIGNSAATQRTVNRTSSQAADADIDAADKIRAMAEAAAASTLSIAGKYIEDGNCVTLTAETTPSKRSNVAPSTTFEILGKPRAKMDGQPTGGHVVATLEGGSALNPANSKVPADARFNYTAPTDSNQKASVALVSRSKRGVGRAAVSFDTNMAAFFASGGADAYHGEGNICDFSKPFVIAGSGVTHNFTPTGPNSGTYQYAGSLEGFAVKGKGTYTVSLSPDGTSGKLIATGGGSVKTPMGVFSNNGSEIYQLTPGQACN